MDGEGLLARRRKANTASGSRCTAAARPPRRRTTENWKGYYGRYEFPPGSINVAPRAPADTWNMWHIKEVDGLLDRLIADMVIAARR